MRRGRFEKTIEGEGDGRRADGGRGRSTDASGASASLTAEERWTLGWVAWTEEAAHVAKVMRGDGPFRPRQPARRYLLRVLTAHLPMARANAVDRDRGSGARYARVDTADLGGLARVLRETMRPRVPTPALAARRVRPRMRFSCGATKPRVHADTLRGARRRRTGGRDDAMGRDETEDENEHVEAEDVGADIWRDPVGPEARVSRRAAAGSGAGAEASSETATSRGRTSRKGRGGARGRERTENGTETGRRRARYTARRRWTARRTSARGEDTERVPRGRRARSGRTAVTTRNDQSVERAHGARRPSGACPRAAARVAYVRRLERYGSRTRPDARLECGRRASFFLQTKPSSRPRNLPYPHRIASTCRVDRPFVASLVRRPRAFGRRSLLPFAARLPLRRVAVSHLGRSF